MHRATPREHPQPESGYFPDRETFCRLASRGNLIPVYKVLLADSDTPVSALRKLDTGKYAFLLESVEGGDRVGRYSFVGSTASVVFRSWGKQVEIERNGATERFEADDPLVSLERLLATYRPVEVPGLPRFYGGAVGYLGYDIVRHFERLPDKNPDPLGLPDAYFLLTDKVLIFDHASRRLQVVVNAHVNGDPHAAYDEAVAAIDGAIEKLHKEVRLEPLASLHAADSGNLDIRSNFTQPEFEGAVRRAKEYIARGDVFQVVLSQRFATPVQSDPFTLYRMLRTVNPSPYMYYLKLGDLAVVGSSPEMLVRVEEGDVFVRPIAGTRRRGRDAAEDEALAEELLHDEKELAEHVMLVDLGRNDVGRVSEYGSVQVEEFMTVERYSHVMHIVSTVRGKLAPGKTAFDAIRAIFPAGTLSGAPKIRAMEIIDELENVRRGPYGGAIAYFGFSGNMDSCITIRTIVVAGGTAYVQAGAGIVLDSDPTREYEETLRKAEGVLTAIAMAEGGTVHARAR